MCSGGKKAAPKGTPTPLGHLTSRNGSARGTHKIILARRIKHWDTRALLINEPPIWWKRVLIRFLLARDFVTRGASRCQNPDGSVRAGKALSQSRLRLRRCVNAITAGPSLFGAHDVSREKIDPGLVLADLRRP
jgi:hypothetical protein